MSQEHSPKLTVEERVCLHLLDLCSLPEQGLLPQAHSQLGVAEGVGIQRGHASVALISLKEKRLVREELARLEGSDRRKKAYFLTREGQEEAVKLKERFLNSKLLIQVDSEERDITPGELACYLPGKPTLAELAGLVSDSGEALDLENLLAEARGEQENTRTPGVDKTTHESGTQPQPPTPGWQPPTGPPDSFPLPPPPPPPPGPFPPPPGVLVKSEPDPQILARRPPLLGAALAIPGLGLLWLYFQENESVLLFFSILVLFGSLLATVYPILLLLNRDQEFKPEPGSFFRLLFSVAIVVLVARSLVEEEFFAGELLVFLGVICPLGLLLGPHKLLDRELRGELCGVLGSLFFLYGLIQTVYPIFQLNFHYPLLWLLSGLFLMGWVLLPNSLPWKREGPDVSAETTAPQPNFLISLCTGAGLFILMLIVARGHAFTDSPLNWVLFTLWIFTAVHLLILRLKSSRRIREFPEQLAAIFLITGGFLFLFAAILLGRVGSYVEAAVEVMVALLLIHLARPYLKPDPHQLLHIIVPALATTLTAYSLYLSL